MKTFLNNLNWKYAIGEIIIVTIGITIAFALNNWAAHQRDRQTKKLYLTNLLKDVEQDQMKLQENVAKLEQKIQLLREIMPHLNATLPGRDSVLHKLFRVSDQIDFIPKDITYRSMINSGDFKVIDDFELKTAIETHYAEYESLLKNYERFENFSKNHLADFYVRDLDYDRVGVGHHDYLESRFFKNIVRSLYGIIGLKLEASKVGVQNCEALLAKIEEV